MNAAQVALRNARGGADPITLDPATVELRERAKRQIEHGDYAGVTATLAALATPVAFNKIDTATIFAPLPPINWIVEELDICPGPPVLIAGYGYSKKTMSVQAAAVSIAAGVPIWGRFNCRRGRVLHVDYEQGRRVTLGRYQRLAAGAGLSIADLDGGLVVVAMPPMYLDNPNAEDLFSRECEGFDLVIVDSLRASLLKTDENNSDVRRVLDMLTRVSEKTGCAPLVIHHARKPSQDKAGGAKMQIRGSGAIFDACSSVLVFDAEKDAPTRVSHEKARTSGQTADDFTLNVEDVAVPDEPHGGLRVVVGEPPTPAEAEEAALAPLMVRVLESLRKDGPAESANALAKRVQGKRHTKLKAIGRLFTDGRIAKGVGGIEIRDGGSGSD